MKSPKEEAKELIDEMYAVHSNSASDITLYFAKQCAIIAVNKILDVIKEIDYGLQYLNLRDHYEEVKEEIENYE
jgi:hypothetical protein